MFYPLHALRTRKDGSPIFKHFYGAPEILNLIDFEEILDKAGLTNDQTSGEESSIELIFFRLRFNYKKVDFKKQGVK